SSSSAPPPLPLIAPGFRFHPTDEELLLYYLRNKITRRPFPFDVIAELNIYSFEPWDLPSFSRLRTRDIEWYFFTPLDRKQCSTLTRTNRASPRGFWKITGRDKEIRRSGNGGGFVIGFKKTLVFHLGRTSSKEQTRTDWVMHEYKLAHEELARIGVNWDGFVVCRVFQKSGLGAKNGEQYGAPYVEEEWEEAEELAVVRTEEEGGGDGRNVEFEFDVNWDWDTFLQTEDIDNDKVFGYLFLDMPDIFNPPRNTSIEAPPADNTAAAPMESQPAPLINQQTGPFVQFMDVESTGVVNFPHAEIINDQVPVIQMPAVVDDGRNCCLEPPDGEFFDVIDFEYDTLNTFD
ncbi:NAC domain-containing protein 53-like, partial [Asparagus officinalis]